MPGGLIQLAILGKQDRYLTIDPQITFFKKVYKKHTNFSMELKEIISSENPVYNNQISFNISNQGDLLHKCYLEIEVPILSITDSIITNSNYITFKNLQLESIQNKIDDWYTKYLNLKNFSSIEFVIYKKLLDILQSENITVNKIKSKINALSNSYQSNRNKYKLLVDEILFTQIDIVGFITNLDSTIDTSTSDIKSDIDTKYNLIIKYLKYYHSNWLYHKSKYDDLNTGNINYSWSEYLGHNYINNYELELGGNIVENYTNDQLHIYQKHYIKNDREDNYYKMIGHDSTNYNFENESRVSKKIIVPLIFWFCQDSTKSLPLLSMKYTSPKINLKINKIKNLIYFQDWEKMYNDLLVVEVSHEDHESNSDGTIKVISDLNYTKIDLLEPEFIYKYTCSNINSKLLDLQFPGIDSSSILTNYGTQQDDLSYLLTLKDYINLMNKLSTDTLLTTNTKQLLGGYHYYIDYNYLINQVPNPVIKLYGEFIYLDRVERFKFASTKLEYIVNLFNEEVYEFNNIEKLDQQLNLLNVTKDLYWFVRPKLLLNGISSYGKIYQFKYNDFKIYTNEIIDNIKILLADKNLLRKITNDNYYQSVTSRNYLNNKLDDGIYYKSLSLFPENTNPSGGANFSKINKKKLELFINSSFRSEYFDSSSSKSLNSNNLGLELKMLSRSYNILIVDKGQSKLIFYQK